MTAEVRAAKHVGGVTRLTKQVDRTLNVDRNTLALLETNSELGAACHRATIASLLEQSQGADRVTLYTPPSLVRDAQAAAAITDAIRARFVE